MLFSRTVASRKPNFESMRNSVIEITATGIEALTVSPTFSTRYSDEAPNTMPSTVPSSTERALNSRRFVAAGMYEANGGGGGFGTGSKRGAGVLGGFPSGA